MTGMWNGVSPPSLLGIYALPPYYHNGTCETLASVLAGVNHRTVNGTLPDVLDDPSDQAKVVKFLEENDNNTRPFE